MSTQRSSPKNSKSESGKKTDSAKNVDEGFVMPTKKAIKYNRRVARPATEDDGYFSSDEDYSYDPYSCPPPPKYVIEEDIDPAIYSVVERQSLIEIQVEDEFTAELANYFERQIKKAIQAKHKMIIIRIDSPGGSVYALNKMLNSLELAKNRGIICATVCTGIAMSCGSILLAMGTKGHRYCGRNSRILLHEISGGMRGNQTNMENELAEYAYDNADLFRKIARNAGIDQNYYLSFVKDLHRDLFIHPARAKYLHLVDHIDLPVVKKAVILEYRLEMPVEDPSEDQLMKMIAAEECEVEPLKLDVLSKIPPPTPSNDPYKCAEKKPEKKTTSVVTTKETLFSSKMSRLPEGLF